MTNADGQYVVRRRTDGTRETGTRGAVDGRPRAAGRREPDSSITVEPSLQEVLTAVFDLREHERETYRALLSAPDSTTSELASVVDRDRSNVNRSLSALAEKGLVTRRRRILEIGGHVYQYTANPPGEVRERLHEALDEWVATAHARIDQFAPDGRPDR